VSRLFVSLYLDEDVSILVGKLLQSRGLTVVTTQQAARLASSDVDQLKFAADRQMAILTHNRADFEELARQYRESQRGHGGIIIAVRRPPHEIVRRLFVLLNQITADEMDNQLLYI
jgi:predicted nuclease of predicted toxin-antitoxin system